MGSFVAKWVAVACAAASLAGCASEPMTDEQRQFAMQYLLAQQANRPPPPQPYYVPIPAPAPVAQPRNCISNVNGNTIYTNCN
jgi:hypothetical protein